MHKPSALIFVVSLIFIFTAHISGIFAEDYEASLAPVLDSAETFFISLENGEHETAWKLLSEKSCRTIVHDVYKSTRKIQKDVKEEDILKDFSDRGLMFRNFWHAFTGNFDPDIILQHSQWEIGYIRQDKAEIVISYRKSEHPARLKMFKENNAWKVGLVETFWSRKYR